MTKAAPHKILVVLYKMTLEASPTIRSIKHYFSGEGRQWAESCELIVWDNSPAPCWEEFEMLRQSMHLNMRLVHTPGNTALSKIYNTVSNELEKNEYLTLLDQDSELPTEYFSALQRAQLEGWPLILPKVVCNKVLVSPGARIYAKGKLLKNAYGGPIRSKNLLAINSGMSAPGEVFNKITYDERLKFYGTDTYFMKQYEKYYPQAYLMNVTIDHTLSERDPEVSAERKAQIEKARRDSWKIIFSETMVERLFLYMYTRALSIRDFIKAKRRAL